MVVLAAWLFTREPPPEPGAMDVRVEDRALRAKIKQAAKESAPSPDQLQAKKDKYSDMLYIPPGPVLIGALKQEFTYKITGATDASDETLAAQNEPSAKEVNMKEGFFIDRFEWPNRLQDQDGSPQIPEVNVTYEQGQRGTFHVIPANTFVLLDSRDSLLDLRHYFNKNF